ncbi:MAG TPA: SDR family NAD(P)-dependent oxidoreductase [Acidimicrobiales bacterium]|nr:SDR family NAD(P)-dependent oxidoreductase [Acidimicrobiales bacterium]
MELRDRTAVVTGASSGIGTETVRALAGRGARVIATARREDRLEALADEVPGVIPVAADVTDPAGRARIAAQAGQVDVLVNNAGIGYFGMVEQMTAEDVERLFEVNVLAAIALTRDVLPGMLERGRGAIVNVSSVGAFVAVPPLTVYSATKFALQGFSEGLRREVAGQGVSVHTVNPGLTRSEFVVAAQGAASALVQAGFNAAGLPAWTVANAVVRAVEADRRPGYAEVAVPRLAGVARFAALPAVSRAIDLASVPGRYLAGVLGTQREPAAPGDARPGEEPPA